ncbi:MAG: hypothetical protein R3E65_05875 [Steroidobacteraceae bacterium]
MLTATGCSKFRRRRPVSMVSSSFASKLTGIIGTELILLLMLVLILVRFRRFAGASSLGPVPACRADAFALPRGWSIAC